MIIRRKKYTHNHIDKKKRNSNDESQVKLSVAFYTYLQGRLSIVSLVKMVKGAKEGTCIWGRFSNFITANCVFRINEKVWISIIETLYFASIL